MKHAANALTLAMIITPASDCILEAPPLVPVVPGVERGRACTTSLVTVAVAMGLGSQTEDHRVSVVRPVEYDSDWGTTTI